jgi:uncharacterized membrane protein YfcA
MLVGAHREAQAGYDKLCISLSTGSLGLSIAYWEKIAGTTTPDWTLLVPLAWVCWLVSALAVLVGYYTSVKHLSELIKWTDERIISAPAKAAASENVESAEEGVAPHKSRSACIVEWANGAAGFLFALGAVFIVVFAWVNMSIS